MRILPAVFFILIAGMALPATAQTKTAVYKNFNPPKLITSIGTYKDSVKLSVADAHQLIALPITVFDKKNQPYKVSSYQVLYRKIVVTPEEKTGNFINTYSLYAQQFISTPLPIAWINKIREEVKPGEEIFFFDVIAKDSQGRVIKAPELKITIR